MSERFGPLQVIRNSFSVVFPKQPLIRRRANDFEDKLRGRYFQPQVISIPDDLDAEMPRLIFGSEHGYSQVVISQVSIVLNVLYSPDWQTNEGQIQSYLAERVPLLFELVDLLDEVAPCFGGLTTQTRMRWIGDNREQFHDINMVLARHLLATDPPAVLHDLHVQTAAVIDDHFFNNLVVENYRTWSIAENSGGILRLPNEAVTEEGVQIVSDFNDRYAYNQRAEYHTNLNYAQQIIHRSFSAVRERAGMIGGSDS